LLCNGKKGKNGKRNQKNRRNRQEAKNRKPSFRKLETFKKKRKLTNTVARRDQKKSTPQGSKGQKYGRRDLEKQRSILSWGF